MSYSSVFFSTLHIYLKYTFVFNISSDVSSLDLLLVWLSASRWFSFHQYHSAKPSNMKQTMKPEEHADELLTVISLFLRTQTADLSLMSSDCDYCLLNWNLDLKSRCWSFVESFIFIFYNVSLQLDFCSFFLGKLFPLLQNFLWPRPSGCEVILTHCCWLVRSPALHFLFPDSHLHCCEEIQQQKKKTVQSSGTERGMITQLHVYIHLQHPS